MKNSKKILIMIITFMIVFCFGVNANADTYRPICEYDLGRGTLQITYNDQGKFKYSYSTKSGQKSINRFWMYSFADDSFKYGNSGNIKQNGYNFSSNCPSLYFIETSENQRTDYWIAPNASKTIPKEKNIVSQKEISASNSYQKTAICNYEITGAVSITVYKAYGKKDWQYSYTESLGSGVKTKYAYASADKIFSIAAKKWNFGTADAPSCPTIYYGLSTKSNTYSFSPRYDKSKYPNSLVAGAAQPAPTSDPTDPDTPDQSGDGPCSTDVTEKFKKNSAAVTSINNSIDVFNQKFNEHTVPINATEQEYNNYRNSIDTLYNSIITNHHFQQNLQKEIEEYRKKNGCVPNVTWDSLLRSLKANYHTVTSMLKTEITKSTKLTQEQKDKLINNIDNDVKDSDNKYDDAVVDFGDWLNELFEEIALEKCEVIDSRLLDKFKLVMTWVKIAVPIIIIVLGSVDFSKAVLFQEKDELQVAFKTFIKRCIIGLAIYLVPTIIEVLVDLFNDSSDLKLVDCLKIFIK